MPMSLVDSFERMLAKGRDDALLRFGLGNAYLGMAEHDRAATHLAAAVAHDPDYSAAWKLLGRALAGAGRDAEAMNAWERGIAAAERRGDKQAAKEMTVFLRRLRKKADAN